MVWLLRGERRAKEFTDGIETGSVTQSHNTAMTSVALISQDRIVTGGRDNLVRFQQTMEH